MKQETKPNYAPEIHRQMIEEAKAYSSNEIGGFVANNPENYKAFREGQDSGYMIAMETKQTATPSPSIHEENKFTKGEWRVIMSGLYVESDNGKEICKINVSKSGYEEYSANAALIAEAKNMYLALKDVLVWFPTHDNRTTKIMIEINNILQRIKQ